MEFDLNEGHPMFVKNPVHIPLSLFYGKSTMEGFLMGVRLHFILFTKIMSKLVPITLD